MSLARIALPLLLALSTAACQVTVANPQPQPQVPTTTRPAPQPAQTAGPIPLSASRSAEAARLAAVARRVEPVAEQECYRRTGSGVNCDITILIDEDPRKQANAFQTLDRAGNPIVVFNAALIRDARNNDELAFVLGHEAAHHILGHIPQSQQSAVLGAVLAGALASAGGISGSGVTMAQDLGAAVGGRAFSKDFELDADRLGTVIAARAGYDPVNGAEAGDDPAVAIGGFLFAAHTVSLL